MATWTAPQPFEELDHTADAGVLVRGASLEEALARLVLGFGQLVAGGGEVDGPRRERTLSVPWCGEDPAVTAVDVVRAAADAFFEEHAIPCAVRDVERAAGVVRLIVAYGPWQEARHADGLDIKAVTWHAARLERDGDGWVGQVVFDI